MQLSRHLNARRSSPLGALLALLWAWAGAHAAPDTAAAPSARELHTAQCVAALDVATDDLAAQVRGGDKSLQPLLLSRLQSGGAFIGKAFLAGERDAAYSKQLHEEALEAQKSLSDAQRAQRQAECHDEGTRLLAAANPIERALVQRMASKRMRHLLAR